MTPYEIPLTPQAQQFYATLGGVEYLLSVKWNQMQSCWLLDIFNLDTTPLVQALPLAPSIDLLTQFKHLGIGGSLYVQSDVDLNQVPQFKDLGTSGHLYFVVS